MNNKKHWQQDRIDKNIIGKKMPLQWEGFVNDLKFEINKLRKEVWETAITEKISIVINIEDTQAFSAILVEQEYLKDECLLSNLKLYNTVGERESPYIHLKIPMYRHIEKKLVEVNIDTFILKKQA